MQYRTQLDQTCGISFKVWTVLQMPIHQMKLCHTKVALSPTSKPKLTFSWITMQGQEAQYVTRRSYSQLSLNKKLEIPSVWDENRVPLQIDEVLSAIKKMKSKEAASPANILTYFLNHLLLWLSKNYFPYSIYLFLFLTAHKSWGLPSSFHYWKLGNTLVKLHLSTPLVSLSCVVKLLELILADSLYHIAATKSFISWFQARFCKGWSCEDQITQMVQAIEDGCQQRPR